MTYGYGQIYVPDDCLKGHAAKSRYRTFVSKSDAEELRKMWRMKDGSKEDQPVACRDQEAMNKFVDNRFLYWGWSSNKDHKKDVKMKRNKMQGKLINDRKRKPRRMSTENSTPKKYSS